MPSIHDEYFRSNMMRIDVAHDFFKAHLPKYILKEINLATLKLAPQNFINENFKNRIADIVYEVGFKHQKGHMFLLVEHQSRADHLMFLRLHEYFLNIVKHYAKQQKKLASGQFPLVYPILFYHGKQPFDFKHFAEYFTHPKLFKRIYAQPFDIVNIHHIPDAKITQHGKAAIFELAQKHIDDKNFLLTIEHNKKLLKSMANQQSGTLIEDMLKYASESKNLNNENDFIKKASYIIEGDKIMTIAKQWQKQGKLEVAKNMIAEGLDLAFIKKLTKLSDRDLKNLLSEQK